MVSKQERILTQRVMKVEALVQEIVKREFAVRWFKPKEEDAIRLLILQQWSEKYKVSVEWILRHLVPIWRTSFAKYQSTGGLGVNIATLVGKKSELILQERLKKEFPDGENLAAWQSKEQSRQWQRFWDQDPKSEDWEFPGTAVKQYQKQMARERRWRKKFQHEQQKRRYRGNPWTT
jgi:hypothetical protein